MKEREIHEQRSARLQITHTKLGEEAVIDEEMYQKSEYAGTAPKEWYPEGPGIYSEVCECHHEKGKIFFVMSRVEGTEYIEFPGNLEIYNILYSWQDRAEIAALSVA